MKKAFVLCLSSFLLISACLAIDLLALDAVSRQPIKDAQITVHSIDTSNPLVFARQAVTDQDGKASINLPDDSARYWLEIFKTGYDTHQLAIDSTSLSLSLLLRPLRQPLVQMFNAGSVKVIINVFEYESLAAFEQKKAVPSSGASVVTSFFRIGDQVVGGGRSQITYGYNRRSNETGSLTLLVPTDAEINFAAFKSGFLPALSSLKPGTASDKEEIINLNLIKVGD